MSRTPAPLLILLAALTLAACGGQGAEQDRARDATDRTPSKEADTPEADPGTAPDATSKQQPPAADAIAAAKRPAGEAGMRVAATRARITTGRSQFGTVLFDANGQVVYAFEQDTRNRSNCTSEECVEAWPPVLTKQPPTAGRGVDAARLGTIRRADGSLQVTIGGRPLYFYAHEAPGEVKCHNVNIHGGYWWVVGPDGVPLDA